MKSTNILIFFLIFKCVSCSQKVVESAPYPITKDAVADSAMVVTAHPLATSVGLDILRQGGNAVDAAIAVQFALAVVYPNAGNIGGGGFMVYRQANGEVAALDFREKASRHATKDMYLDSLGNPVTDKSLFGHLAAGVPGTVDGMVKAFEKHSQLKNWKALLAPAITLAEEGFQITAREANHLNEEQGKFTKYNRANTAFHKKQWKAGDLLQQKELAKTLLAISERDRAGFYEGETARLIVEEMKAGNGLIDFEDLKSYSAVWRRPVVGHYRGHKIISMPAPSSGGIALVQLLKMIEPYNLKEMGFQSPSAVHLMVEAERRVFADRATFLGDPDFYKVPQATLLDSNYIQTRMADFNPRQASKSNDITHGNPESEETTHFSIVDTQGNAVAVTTTLNGSYGSFTVVSGAGFILNNEMDDFSVKPGSPNMYGLLGAEANKIEPGKRMLSSMTPTIVEKDGKLLMVAGTPGGSTIITTVFQVIVNILDFGMTVSEAVSAPRFHHQWLPDIIAIEKDAIEKSSRAKLEAIGHTLKDRGHIGRVEAILVGPDGKLHGAADPRGDDDAKGY